MSARIFRAFRVGKRRLAALKRLAGNTDDGFGGTMLERFSFQDEARRS